jgi:hypothetical protein
MKRLTKLIFPCVDEMNEAQARGNDALRELTKACAVRTVDVSIHKKKMSVNHEFKVACF